MEHPGKEIWTKELSDGAWAVCLFNTGEKPLKIRMHWPHLSFLSGAYRVRDVWAKKDLGLTDHDGVFEPIPHDVVLLVLRPAGSDR